MQEMKSPPGRPVPWLAVSKKTGESVKVVAALWFLARREAMALLGCDPNELDITLIPEESLPQPSTQDHVKKAKKKTKAQGGKKR